MEKNKMRMLIRECLNNIGIYIELELDDLFIDEYLEDSITYISFIVEIEEMFHISIPDQYLQNNYLETFNDIINLIQEVLSDDGSL